MPLEKGKSLKELTTLKIGVRARFFVEIKKDGDLKEIFKEKRRRYVIGSGSNIVASDGGFPGLIVKIATEAFKRNGNKVYVGAGNNLLEFIKRIDRLGFAGMEKMAGIPGTVAGAIYGNAGAYGQEIRENILRVRIFDGFKFKWIKKSGCKLGYRDSIFKKNKNWIIVGAEFLFKQGNPRELSKISNDIIKLREKKYKPGLLCPGSFFKNIIFKNISRSQRSKIPQNKVIYGKVPTGYLLEEVGAKGMSCGKIKVARHHGNLFYNAGGGRAGDIKKLASILKGRVYRKFGVRLEEEVQYLE